MEDERFARLRSRGLSWADRRPAVYMWAVRAVGLLGYLYLAGVVVLVGVTTVALATLLAEMGVGPLQLRVALPYILLGLLVLSALRTPVTPAAGLVVTRREAPPLHALVESLRLPLRAATVHGILVGSRLEISRVRVPRLGSLLGFRNHLVIGLPLLLALPLPQFRALLAHELAHLTRTRRIDGIRIHRLRDRWLQLADALAASRHPASVLMRPFICWYAPRFAAFAFGIARRHEYAADRLAAGATGRDDLAQALLRVGVVERFLAERFYPRLLADVREFGVPPSGLESRLTKALRGVTDDSRFGAWLDHAVLREASADTHPATANRLAALGLASEQADRDVLCRAAFSERFAGESTARHGLRSVSRDLVLSIEHAWIEDVMQAWAERHEELLRWDERRRQLDDRADLSATEALELAISTAAIEGADNALPILRRLLEREPDMPPARFVLGTLLLRRNEPEGLAQIERAIELDSTLRADGTELACEYLRVTGRHREARLFLDRFGLAGGTAPATTTVAYEPPSPAPVAHPAPENAPPVPERANPAPDKAKPAPDHAYPVPEKARPVSEKANPAYNNGRPSPAADSPPERDRSEYRNHGLAYPEVLAVKRGIAPLAAVARAFLVRETAHSRELPARAVTVPTRRSGAATGEGGRYLLAVELMRGDHDPHITARRLAGRITLPGPGVIAILTRRDRRLRRALESLDDSLLFQRTRKRAA